MAEKRLALVALFKSRYVLILAVFSIYLLACTLLVYSTLRTVWQLPGLVGSFSPKTGKELLLFAIETTDLLLVAVVLYVTAAGLYALFISRTSGGVPSWLEIETLDDLKDKLIGVVVVVMAVYFLGKLISDTPSQDILGLGVGIGALVAALGWYVSQKSKAKESDVSSKKEESKIEEPKGV